MSSAWLNIRFGLHHLILGERWLLSVRVSQNPHHIGDPTWIELHSLRLFGLIIK